MEEKNKIIKKISIIGPESSGKTLLANILSRIINCKKIVKKNKFIKVRYFENLINSSKTSDLIDYLYKTQKYELFFIMSCALLRSRVLITICFRSEILSIN